MNINGKDLVAAVSIPCFSILIYYGHNGAVIALLGTIIGWYYGQKTQKET